MSFEKYSARKIEEKSYDLIEGAISLRRLASEMVEEHNNGEQDAFVNSVEATSRILAEMSTKMEILKSSFSHLVAGLTNVNLADENGEIEIIVEQDENGIKF